MGRRRVAVRTPRGEGRQLVVLRLAACTGRGKKRHCFQLVLGQPGGSPAGGCLLGFGAQERGPWARLSVTASPVLVKGTAASASTCDLGHAVLPGRASVSSCVLCGWWWR